MTAPENSQVKPSPTPRPKPAVSQKSGSERLTGVADKPDTAKARKRGRTISVTDPITNRTWERFESDIREGFGFGQGWCMAHEIVADPTVLDEWKARHATEPDPQVELDAYLAVEVVVEPAVEVSE